MTGDVATTTGSGLALRPDQDFWDEKQMAALRQLGVERASNGDLAVFMHVAQRTGLDPFARQLYLIERAGKQTIQTGIDGFRLVARRAADRVGETLEYEDTLWADADGAWHDVWTKTDPPAAAKATILRDGKRFSAVALFREYAQTRSDGTPLAMWARMPAHMLAKCAEALVLRKAYPQDLSGIYTDDEMAAAGSRRQVSQGNGSAKERLAAALNPDAAPSDEEPVDGEVVEDPADSPVLDLRSQLAKRMFVALSDLGIRDEEQHEWLSGFLGRPIASRKDLTEHDAHRVIDEAEGRLADNFAEPSEPPAEQP